MTPKKVEVGQGEIQVVEYATFSHRVDGSITVKGNSKNHLLNYESFICMSK